MLNRRTFVSGAGAAGIAALAGRGGAQVPLPKDPRYAGMVLGVGPAGHFDDAKVGIGVPRWDPSARRFVMWYYGRDRAYRADAPPSLGTGRIGVATSTDFIHWTRQRGAGFGGSVIEAGGRGSFDYLHVGTDDVTRVGDDWYMWLFGGDETPIQFRGKTLYGYHLRSGLARSRDGMTWQRLPGAAAGGSLIDIEPAHGMAAWPNGLHDGEKFVLFYTTTDLPVPSKRFDSRIAFSRDGKTWEKQGPLRFSGPGGAYDDAGQMTRHVLRNPLPGPRWLMLYTAMNGSADRFHQRSIAAATSDNLVDWQRLYGAPIFDVGPAANWDGGGVAAPQLVDHKGVLHMSYYGFGRPDADETLPHAIGAAIAAGRDLRAFRRVKV